MTNEVFTCNSPDCARFLYNGKALLEVIIGEKEFSIDPLKNFFQYANEDTKIKTRKTGNGYLMVEKPEAKCPHCSGAAQVVSMPFELEVDKENLLREIDKLDDMITQMMSKYGNPL